MEKNLNSITRKEIIDATTFDLIELRNIKPNRTITVAFMTQPYEYLSEVDFQKKYYKNPEKYHEETIKNDYKDYNAFRASFEAIPNNQETRKLFIERSIDFWGKYTNINFSLVENQEMADIKVAYSIMTKDNFKGSTLESEVNGIKGINHAIGHSAQAKPGDVFINTLLITDQKTLKNTIAHEFGHALGLTHFHQNLQNGGSSFDYTIYGIMSYGSILMAGGIPQTPMLFDLIGLKSLGLLKDDINKTDTIHQFDNQFDSNGVIKSMTIIDTGGTDIIDASKTTTKNEIDLRITDIDKGKIYFSSIGGSETDFNSGAYLNKKYNVSLS